MAKITHPSMRSGRGTSAPRQSAPETFVVDDATNAKVDENSVPNTEEVDEIDTKLKQFETSSSKYHTESTNLPSKEDKKLPKKTLEELLFAGRIERDFSIAGNKYSLSTLTNKEQNSIIKELYNFGKSADLFVIKSLSLALALKSINDVPLDQIDLDVEHDNDLYNRKEVIDSLQNSVVEKLYEHYSSMVKESEDVVTGDDLKK